MARALINVPSKAKRGDIVEIKTLLSHPMETGFRTGVDGALVPREIINRFVCTYNGEVVFSAELFPAVSANPFISFTTVATDSGTLVFSWTDDQGKTQVQTAPISVE
ncbi:MAG: thiosulfate oxidation carrier complex protein SoxZ [Beijerinckiaceae bacterium]|jgi:sulfur-oxidizing protein SoxZ|nr:thiosulfate oxidation carrier complex protein SoxZ [Beijerinckiaceae bacterium]MDO9441658.1 thiosulfate oxidation carrier complex protein SoxZ [Beijerinckiaceae bacterium]